MNEKIIEMMRSILKEELNPINHRLNAIETTMATKDDIANMATKDDIANMDANMRDIGSRVKNIETIQDRKHRVIELLVTHFVEHEEN